MRFRLLGSLEVQADDGRSVWIPAPRRRQLLAILLLDANRPVSSDRLAEALWGAELPDAARQSLHAHVSRLRREIGPDRIVTRGAGYLIRVGEGELDVRDAEGQIAVGHRAAAEGRWSTAAAAFGAAIEQWRGPPLADFDGEPFAEPEIARLEALRHTALEGRIDADLARGRHAELIGELEALVAQHPYRERLWHDLMLALYRSGRQADALAAYRRVRTRLRDDLGIDPSPDLQALEVRILRQDPGLKGPPAGHVQPEVRLPSALTPLVGRRSEIEQAIEILRGHRLLTLTGPGGVGKTRLAVTVAGALIPDYPDGTLFVDLSAVRDPSAVLGRIGELAGGGDRPHDVIGRRRMLLVLDNFEQVVDAAPAVGELLGSCPNLRVIVTSRAPLRVAGERRLDVPPLPPGDAAALFTDRAQAALASVHLPGNVVADVVADLDGLPLAVELAAARVPTLSMKVLRERLADRLSILSSGRRDAPDRHQTLRATIAWSYELLGVRAREAFRRLSVLAGGFDLAAAEAVAQTDVDGVQELVDQSLVQRIDDRFHMLETIREFAVAEAAAHLETEAARDRHLVHFLEAATSVHRSPAGATEGVDAWAVLCRTERENLRAAVEWAIERNDATAVASLYRAIGMNWVVVGAIDEGMRWGAAAIEASRAVETRTQIAVHLIASEFPRFSGDPAGALALKERALEIGRIGGHHDVIAMTLGDVASIHATRGDFRAARDSLAAAFRMHDAEPSCDPSHRAHTVATAIEMALLEGRVEEAVERLAELDRLEPPIGAMHPAAVHTVSEVENTALRARVLAVTGRVDEAAAALTDVIRGAVQLEFRMPLADALEQLAQLRATRDAPAAARLVGMADRVRAEARSPVRDPEARATTLAAVRSALGADRFAVLHAEGHALTLPAMADAALVPAGPSA